MNIIEKIATQLTVKPTQVAAAVKLLDEGATVPFIARYRKEVTDGLSDTDLRTLSEQLVYLRELEERRNTILKSIAEQNKLTPELEKAISTVENKAELEDLYLPYKPKRRTKAQIAREAGLEPLALGLLQNPDQDPEQLSLTFINAELSIATSKDALDGARQILLEMFSENAEILGHLREYIWQQGILTSEVIKEKEATGKKFADYYQYQEPIKKIPSHRALALFRGRREEILKVSLILTETDDNYGHQQIANQFGIKDLKRAADAWLWQTVIDTWRLKIFTKLEVELMVRLREQSEEEAIRVFANNLKHLMMAAPAGTRVTLGLDPGLRTGVKTVVIDGTGKLLGHIVIYPHVPQNQWQVSIDALAKLCQHFNVELISIGNGTASRETEKLVAELKKAHPTLKFTSVVVSEAGASVYSASELASAEFPDLDVSYRGAVSIARRLQDPLAELIKIDPKSIGVGQYQHDVNQTKLSKSLHAVMEDCVNAVGVDVNTASVPLLASVAGLNQVVAKNIVEFREAKGAFINRQVLKKVPRLGEKAYEQAAGFLRIVNGENPLDASAVHPEAYPLVEKILNKQQKSLKEVMGNVNLIKQLNVKDYIDDQFGAPTVLDIFKELEKPGRDPRPDFKTATFKEGVDELKDLKTGMILEGVITNVANFGAFVDIGVHQDGLVHKSLMADRFVTDPNEVVKVGDIVKVKVLEIDLERKRVSLSMRLSEDMRPKPANRGAPPTNAPRSNQAAKFKQRSAETKPAAESALAFAFRDALQKKGK